MECPIAPKSITFAPMEGITDENYRTVIEKHYPEWSYYNTDFLRIPSAGIYSKDKIVGHFGHEIFQNKRYRSKTGYQILAAQNSLISEHIERINELEIKHLDLNLGCPSKKVNGHRGGAYLLKDLKALEEIVKKIRNLYPYFFSAKIRIGFEDDKNFKNIIHLLEHNGVDAITIHGRTRKQQYDGRANWSYIKWAVENSSLPIIGNGDIWTVKDAIDIFHETNCHAVMLGRCAMKTPWFPQWFEQYKDKPYQIIDEVLLAERKEHLEFYFHVLEKQYRSKDVKEENILKRFKALSRFCFDDYPNASTLKSTLLRSMTMETYKKNLHQFTKS